MKEEKWAEIEGYPDYAVSDHGRVKSLRFNKILKPRENSYGHPRVVLYRDKVPRDFYVNHLVAAAFIDGYIPGLRVEPRDEDKLDANVYNLKFRIGQRMGSLVRNPTEAKERRVLIVETGAVFRTVADCANHIGGHTSSIYRVLRGERETHLGYTFKYIEESI